MYRSAADTDQAPVSEHSELGVADDDDVNNAWWHDYVLHAPLPGGVTGDFLGPRLGGKPCDVLKGMGDTTRRSFLLPQKVVGAGLFVPL